MRPNIAAGGDYYKQLLRMPPQLFDNLLAMVAPLLTITLTTNQSNPKNSSKGFSPLTPLCGFLKLCLHLPSEVTFIKRQRGDCYRDGEIISEASNKISEGMHSVEQCFISAQTTI